MFPFDRRGTDVSELCHVMFKSVDNMAYRNMYCNRCKTENFSDPLQDADIWYCSKLTWKSKSARLGSRNNQSTSVWFKAILRSKSSRLCFNCNTVLDRVYVFDYAPMFIPLTIDNDIPIMLEQIAYMYENKYRLIGIIYHGAFHFTSRIIDINGDIWYHDGLKTGRTCLQEGNIKNIDCKLLLKSRERRKANVAVYMLEEQ